MMSKPHFNKLYALTNYHILSGGRPSVVRGHLGRFLFSIRQTYEP
jgi:hypothetical protein